MKEKTTRAVRARSKKSTAATNLLLKQEIAACCKDLYEIAAVVGVTGESLEPHTDMINQRLALRRAYSQFMKLASRIDCIPQVVRGGVRS